VVTGETGHFTANGPAIVDFLIRAGAAAERLHLPDMGRSTMIRANTDNRLVEPLAELLFLSWGPLQVVADEFSDLEGAEQVLIFGSWAARYLQTPGRHPMTWMSWSSGGQLAVPSTTLLTGHSNAWECPSTR